MAFFLHPSSFVRLVTEGYDRATKEKGLREQRNQTARKKLAGSRLLLRRSWPITKREAAPVIGRTEGGEETKAARLSLSRAAIADSSHPNGMLQWSIRLKKRNGPWVLRAAAVTR